MIQYSLNKRWFLLSVAVLAMGCAGSQTTRGSQSSQEVQRQLLQYQEARLHQRQFFVGIASGHDLNQATAAAYQEITRQLTWLPTGSQDMLKGLYRVDRTEADNAGGIHVLAVLEREAAASYLRKMAQEKEAKVKLQLALCKKQLKTGEVQAAQACLSEVNMELERARDLFAASRTALGDALGSSVMPIEDEAAQLAGQISASQTHRRSAILRIVKEIDGKVAGDVDAQFAPILSEHDLKRVTAEISSEQIKKVLAGSSSNDLLSTARSADAGYIIVGLVKSQFVSEDNGQYFSRADGMLRIIETTGGRTVAEISTLGIKGGHVTKNQANEKAINGVMQELKGKLATKLDELKR